MFEATRLPSLYQFELAELVIKVEIVVPGQTLIGSCVEISGTVETSSVETITLFSSDSEIQPVL